MTGVAKTYRDFMPEYDRDLAAQHPGYEDAWRKTFAGQIAELKAAAWPLGDEFHKRIVTIEERFGRLRDRSLARWFRDHR